MFFSGDPSTRKRVDLGGRSSKERDRKKLLEQTRLERDRRLFQRQQNSAATKIQVGFGFSLSLSLSCQRPYFQFYVNYENLGPNIGAFDLLLLVLLKFCCLVSAELINENNGESVAG